MTLKEELIAKAQVLGLKTDGLTIAKLKEAIAIQNAGPKEVTEKISETEVKAETPDEETEADEAAFAKSGKRSRKSVIEKEAELAKQTRKTEAEDKPVAPKPKPVPPTRPKSERRGKKYKQVVKKVDIKKTYPAKEALALISQTATTKFDSSVEIVVSLGVDAKIADQNVRDFVILPAGLGKKIRVAVFADEQEAAEALKAGASVAGKEVFLQQLEKGLIDFDILITSPHLMASLSKYAKLLGPKGLMPNPKSGTITKDIVRATEEAQMGRVEYRVDEHGLVHLPIGKVSFSKDQLEENLMAIMKSIQNNKPNSLKNVYIQSVHISTTMGPSLKMALPI